MHCFNELKISSLISMEISEDPFTLFQINCPAFDDQSV